MEFTPFARQTLLLVEDNPKIAEFVRIYLERADYTVLVAEGCREGMELLQQQQPDLILLDVLLDDGTGFDFCRTVRRGGLDGSMARLVNVPILMLTAKADECDRLEGFRCGADDYVTKPFSPDELVCRVQAILRRSNGISHGVLEAGPLAIDPVRHEVKIGQRVLEMAPKEFELLYILASNAGQVYSREYLLERVWGYSYAGNTRTVDVHVNRLRQKLSVEEGCDAMITTEWGVGYKFVALEAAVQAREVGATVAA
ncbi:MAG: response regulator transcription factor [Chloroflexaceae bacterium]|jgi:DNA-binding response OmpR family regulator|nr:response regulator transcription factor [Chloroflexaceae bacterium]